ncbi:MAG: TetR family transcriptional regulator [Streptosporangiales bacterium]|nr:TetR family transcriptional regulator [Streptosporangiales bacterium]
MSQLLDAAATVFTRYGYAATTIDAIAEQLGATKRRVYHYYRAKSDIFLDLIIAGMQEMIDGVAPLAIQRDVSSVDRLWRMAHYHAGLMMTRNSYQRVAVQAVEMHRLQQLAVKREPLDKFIALRDEYERLFADVIDEGKRDGYLRDVDPRLATKPVLGALNWISLWYDPERGDYAGIAKVADEYADFVVNGLRRNRP